MYRLVAIATLVAGQVLAAPAEEGQGGAMQTDSTEANATERARQALAKHLQIAADAIVVTGAAPKTWNDSSMGCGKPGTAALTMMTDGYAVSLSAQGREYEVHVSKANAVVCEGLATLRTAPRERASVRGLDAMLQQAKQDLAEKLGVDAATIRTSGMKPLRFADSGLDCPREGESLQQGPINGYQLALKHGGRFFTYHTDMKSVRACPPLEDK